METDIFYKPTNSHQYLDYHSFHPTHVKDNIPFSLAKRIICFVSDTSRMEYRLNQLKVWLLACNYPINIIEKGIFNSRLQGPAPKRIDKCNVIPFVTTYASNLSTSSINSNIRTLISARKHGRLHDVLCDVEIVAAYKQPSNLGNLLTRARFCDQKVEFGIPLACSNPQPGLFANCMTVDVIYVSFDISNHVRLSFVPMVKIGK